MATYCYENKGNPSALLFFLPGYGDHSQHYGYFFKKLAEEHHIRTYTADRRGFGESQGKRGDILDDETMIQEQW